MSSSSEEIHHRFLFERSDRPWWPTVYHPLSSCCITFCFPLRCFYYSIFFSCLHLPTGLLLATLSRCSVSKRELPLHEFLFVKSVSLWNARCVRQRKPADLPGRSLLWLFWLVRGKTFRDQPVPWRRHGAVQLGWVYQRGAEPGERPIRNSHKSDYLWYTEWNALSSEFFYAPAQIFRDEILLFYAEIHRFFDIRRKERYENYFYPPQMCIRDRYNKHKF